MQTMTVMALVAEAKGRIQNLSPDEVARELENGEVVLVDLREPAELAEQGVIPGAIHAPRGMLEFYADPASAYHTARSSNLAPGRSCTAPPAAAQRWHATASGASATSASRTSTAASRPGSRPASPPSRSPDPQSLGARPARGRCGSGYSWVAAALA
jgi:hypothetical protein